MHLGTVLIEEIPHGLPTEHGLVHLDVAIVPRLLEGFLRAPFLVEHLLRDLVLIVNAAIVSLGRNVEVRVARGQPCIIDGSPAGAPVPTHGLEDGGDEVQVLLVPGGKRPTSDLSASTAL